MLNLCEITRNTNSKLRHALLLHSEPGDARNLVQGTVIVLKSNWLYSDGPWIGRSTISADVKANARPFIPHQGDICSPTISKYAMSSVLSWWVDTVTLLGSGSNDLDLEFPQRLHQIKKSPSDYEVEIESAKVFPKQKMYLETTNTSAEPLIFLAIKRLSIVTRILSQWRVDLRFKYKQVIWALSWPK